MKKLLQMKKYIIGFIVAIISIFAINNNVKAINLNGVEIEPPVDLTTNAFILATSNVYKLDGVLYEYVATSIESFDYVGFYYDSAHSSLYLYPADHSSWPKSQKWGYLNGVWYKLFYDFSYLNSSLSSVIWSNVDIIQYNTQEILYYADTIQVEPTIEMTKTWANDLENNDIYIIRSDFTNSFNTNYKYQIKTDYIDWLDVTSDVLLASQSGYYFYDYTLKYNSKLYARVLDSNNEVIVTNEIEVTELNDYIEISHLPANDLQNRYINVIKFDLRHAYNENHIFQYSYDNKTFYNMSVDIDNQIFYLNHAVNIPIYFRIIDNDSNLIYEQKYDVYFSDLEKEVLIKEKTNFIDGVKSININIDFTEYLKFFDMYNFKIVVDGVIYNEETFLLTLTSTEDNFIKFIDIKIYIDDLLIEDIGYRTGTFGATGGGSDIDNFEDMFDKVLENELSTNESYFDMFKNSFSEFKEDISLFISNINELWLTIPDVLRRFFIVIFSIILFGFVIRFIL